VTLGWKDKVDYKEMVLFCDIYRSREELEKRFKLTKTESIHALRWFAKFDDDFIIEKDVGGTGRAWWIKATKQAYEEALKH